MSLLRLSRFVVLEADLKDLHMEQKRQFHLRTMFIATACVGLFLFVVERMIGPAMPRDLLRQIDRGMPKERVREILGKPRRIGTGGGPWQYARAGNLGYVEVFFDRHGRVVEINDESMFP